MCLKSESGNLSPKGVEKILGQDTSGVLWPRRVKVPSCVKKKYLLSIKRTRTHAHTHVCVYIYIERDVERILSLIR